MIVSSLQRRDWEILRTLCRLRFVTTQQIVGAFFGTATVGGDDSGASPEWT